MSNNVNWSELHADVLQLILERLNIVTYVGARTVCKNWYAVCKRITSVQDKSPWLIIFPAGRPKCGSCLVLDFHTFRLTGKYKFYRLHNLGNDFSSHRCIATCGGWLLMFDLRSSLYVVNVFTRERIDLPPLESDPGRLRVERRPDTNFIINKSSVTTRNAINKTNAVLWVDERTKRYIVVWSIGLWYMMYTRSGFDSWREIPTREGPENLHGCQGIAYKDNKLYVLSRQNQIRILDFSQELPLALPNNVEENPFTNEKPWRVKIGVTASENVLMVKNRLNKILKILKMDSGRTSWDTVESLEGEAWIMDLGVTIPAVNGINPNSIYYSKDKYAYWGEVSTQELKKALDVDLNRNFSYARWFIPSLREL
ncbi:putative F-box protein [Raphanus sativus]|uniref:Probable F-box protein At4g22060 n=1 Tax=Raphanus sativus TaxID=3726 RepID=A0A6J0NKR3_RAPSA|nr:probable F-box protein At4g22060 [Raphanus sativus]KAJ4903487.1 putative F-box protein [Raphanus sativus]